MNIGVPYPVANYPASLSPATGGCRNIAGQVDDDGIATIYAVTSTISGSGDQGADPNRLVKISDRLAATTPPKAGKDFGSLGHFVILRTAKAGEVFHGVALAPKSED